MFWPQEVLTQYLLLLPARAQGTSFADAIYVEGRVFPGLFSGYPVLADFLLDLCWCCWEWEATTWPSAAGGKETYLGLLLLVGRRLEDSRPRGATGAVTWLGTENGPPCQRAGIVLAVLPRGQACTCCRTWNKQLGSLEALVNSRTLCLQGGCAYCCC